MICFKKLEITDKTLRILSKSEEFKQKLMI